MIHDHGIDYERGKFADKIRDKTLTTERTAAWLRQAIAASPAEVVDNAREGCRVAFKRIHASAIATLVAGGEPLPVEAAPETLLFDAPRITNMRTEFDALVGLESAVVVVGATKDAALIRSVRAAVDATMATPGTALDPEALGLTAAVAPRVKAAMVPGSPVHSLMRLRMVGLIRRSIAEVGVLILRFVGDLGLSAITPQGPQPADPHGGAFAHRRAKLVRDVCAVAVLNREIHTSTYNALISGILHAANAAV